MFDDIFITVHVFDDIFITVHVFDDIFITVHVFDDILSFHVILSTKLMTKLARRRKSRK